LKGERLKFVWCAHVHLPGYMNETAELPLPHMNLFSVCDVSYGRVFTVAVCVTKAYASVWLFVEMFVNSCSFFLQ